MMKINKEEAFELLKKIGFVRTAGSKEEMQAAEILKAEAENAGVTTVIEPFAIADATCTCAELEILEPYNKKYTITAYKCCSNTPDNGLETEFVYAENVMDVNLASVKGKIVLVNGFMRLPVYKKLAEAGAAAFITMSGTMLDKDGETDLFTRKLRPAMHVFGVIPAGNIRISDAFDIVSNKASKAKLTIIGETIELTSHNVIATIKGTEKPEEVISFGAHYDSTEFSTGVYDNGAGSVLIMELLKYFTKNPPIRTLKFLWFGSEEIGLEGSKAYTKSHKEELKDYILMINVDVGAPVLGYNVCKVMASKNHTAFVDGLMKTRGHAVDVKQGIYSSDSVPFADNGVPAINFSRDSAPGASFIHSRNDVIKYLSADALAALMPILFEYSTTMVGAAAFPEPREIPVEIKEEVDKYLFKKELGSL